MTDIYINIVNKTELHRCVIDSDGGAVWMYLHDLSERCVIGDAPICSLLPLISLADFKRKYQRGETPPLVQEHSTKCALIPNLSNNRIDVIWSQDDRSVAALIDEEPFAMIITDLKKGFSKAISHIGPWGNPWSDVTFNKIFGEQPL